MIYIKSTKDTWYKRWTKHILRSISPKKQIWFTIKIREIVDSILPGDKYINIVSTQYWNYIYGKDMFDNLRYYKFEDTEFLGPFDYDKYLSSCYGDYMRIPSMAMRKNMLRTIILQNSIIKRNFFRCRRSPSSIIPRKNISIFVGFCIFEEK